MSGYDVGQDEEARIVSWDGRAAKAEPSLPRVSPGDSASRWPGAVSCPQRGRSLRMSLTWSRFLLGDTSGDCHSSSVFFVSCPVQSGHFQLAL